VHIRVCASPLSSRRARVLTVCWETEDACLRPFSGMSSRLLDVIAHTAYPLRGSRPCWVRVIFRYLSQADAATMHHVNTLSPVTITSDTATIDALGLAPMAVLPAYQKMGMGSKLVEAGLHACHHTPYGVVVVLGHGPYSPRCGFTPATQYGMVWEHDVPEEVCMVARATGKCRGTYTRCGTVSPRV
jgi:GNAT superfamily N-acetyltransferase